MSKNRVQGRPAVIGLTQAQKRCLAALSELMEERSGIPPTVQELGDRLNLVPATVHAHLKQLIKKGYIKREPGAARGLQLLRQATAKIRTVRHIPILGEVVAGQPLLSEECLLGNLAVDGNLIQGGTYFALRVKGESMRDANIHAGDYVIVRQQPLAETGDIVVAIVDDEATVKRLKLQPDGTAFLVPENPKFKPIPITSETRFQLLGKVIATSKLQGGS